MFNFPLKTDSDICIMQINLQINLQFANYYQEAVNQVHLPLTLAGYKETHDTQNRTTRRAPPT